jgi:hypothetical protein
VLMDREEAKLYGRAFLGSLIIFAICAVYLTSQAGLRFVIMIWLYWQPFHVLKQHLGIAKIYNGKNGYRGPFGNVQASLVLGCLAPVLYRISTSGFKFNHYVLWGRELPFSGMSFPAPPVPHAVVVLCYVFFAAYSLIAIVEQISLARKGEKTLPLATIGNLGLAIVSFNVAYVFVSSLYATILIASAVHSFQYHALCWCYNHRRSTELPQPDSGAARLLTFLSQKQTIPLYVGFILSLGGAVALLDLFASGLIPLIIVLHHFYFDSLIWKPSSNPNLKVGLGLGTTRAA